MGASPSEEAQHQYGGLDESQTWLTAQQILLVAVTEVGCAGHEPLCRLPPYSCGKGRHWLTDPGWLLT